MSSNEEYEDDLEHEDEDLNIVITDFAAIQPYQYEPIRRGEDDDDDDYVRKDTENAVLQRSTQAASECADDRPYCDRFYQGRPVHGLPRDLEFDGDVKLTIDYAWQSEVTSSLPALLESASARGDNVGTDEFMGQSVEFLTKYAFIFTVRRRRDFEGMTTSSIAAFIIIGPPTFSIVADPSSADVHVIRSGDVPDPIYYELIDISIDLTRLIDVGYMDCIMSVSVSCDDMIDVLTRRLQFKVIATIPKSVYMANSVGLVDSELLIRNIMPPDQTRQPRSPEDVLSMLAKHGFADGPEDDALYSQATLPSIHILPQQYVLSAANLAVNVRNMYKNEDHRMFYLLNCSAKLGEGFAEYDPPNLAVFRQTLLMDGPCVVFEDSATGSMIGFMTFSPSCYMRSRRAACAQTTIVFAKQYQSRGIGRGLFQLMNALVKSYGFKRIATEHFTNNVRSQRMSASVYNSIGTIPRAAYLTGSGWQGQVIQHVELPEEPTVAQIFEANRRLCQRSADP